MEKIKHFNIRTDLWYDMQGGYWVDFHDNVARIGMSPLVQETSGAFVAVSMNKVGSVLAKGESFGSVEAEKHVGHMSLPVSGKIISVNEKVIEQPRLLNTDPYNTGWLVEIECSQLDIDKENLLSGEDKVIAWFKNEIDRYEKKGWLAES